MKRVRPASVRLAAVAALLLLAGGCASVGSPLPRGSGVWRRWHAVPGPTVVWREGSHGARLERLDTADRYLLRGVDDALVVRAEPGAVLRFAPVDPSSAGRIRVERLHAFGGWVAAIVEPALADDVAAAPGERIVSTPPGLPTHFRVSLEAPPDGGAPVAVEVMTFQRIERVQPEYWERLEDRARRAFLARAAPRPGDLTERSSPDQRFRAFGEEIASLVPWAVEGASAAGGDGGGGGGGGAGPGDGLARAVSALVLGRYYLFDLAARADDGAWAFDEEPIERADRARVATVGEEAEGWLEQSDRAEPVELTVSGPALLRIDSRLVLGDFERERFGSYELAVGEGDARVLRELVWTQIDDALGLVRDDRERPLCRSRRVHLVVPPGEHRYAIATDAPALLRVVVRRKRLHVADAFLDREDPAAHLDRARSAASEVVAASGDDASEARRGHYILAAVADAVGDRDAVARELDRIESLAPRSSGRGDHLLDLAAARLRAKLAAERGDVAGARALLDAAIERVAAPPSPIAPWMLELAARGARVDGGAAVPVASSLVRIGRAFADAPRRSSPRSGDGPAAADDSGRPDGELVSVPHDAAAMALARAVGGPLGAVTAARIDPVELRAPPTPLPFAGAVGRTARAVVGRRLGGGDPVAAWRSAHGRVELDALLPLEGSAAGLAGRIGGEGARRARRERARAELLGRGRFSDPVAASAPPIVGPAFAIGRAVAARALGGSAAEADEPPAWMTSTIVKRARLEAAGLLVAEGRVLDAAERYEQVIGGDPDDATARLGLVGALLELHGDETREPLALAHVHDLLARVPGLDDARRHWRTAYYVASYWQDLAPLRKPAGRRVRATLPVRTIDEQTEADLEAASVSGGVAGSYRVPLDRAFEVEADLAVEDGAVWATLLVLPPADARRGRWLPSRSAANEDEPSGRLLVIRAVDARAPILELPLLGGADELELRLPVGVPLMASMSGVGEDETPPEVVIRGQVRLVEDGLGRSLLPRVGLVTLHPLGHPGDGGLEFRFLPSERTSFLRLTVVLEGARGEGGWLHLRLNGEPIDPVRLGLRAVERALIEEGAAQPLAMGSEALRVYRFRMAVPPRTEAVSATWVADPAPAGDAPTDDAVADDAVETTSGAAPTASRRVAAPAALGAIAGAGGAGARAPDRSPATAAIGGPLGAARGAPRASTGGELAELEEAVAYLQLDVRRQRRRAAGLSEVTEMSAPASSRPAGPAPAILVEAEAALKTVDQRPPETHEAALLDIVRAGSRALASIAVRRASPSAIAAELEEPRGDDGGDTPPADESADEPDAMPNGGGASNGGDVDTGPDAPSPAGPLGIVRGSARALDSTAPRRAPVADDPGDGPVPVRRLAERFSQREAERRASRTARVATLARAIGETAHRRALVLAAEAAAASSAEERDAAVERRDDEAGASLGAALDWDHTVARARLLRGRALLKLGELRLGIADLLAARDAAPAGSAVRSEALGWLGLAYAQEGEEYRALRAFDEALAEGAAEGPIRLALAGVLGALGRSDEAAQRLEAWLAKEPADAEAWVALGRARLQGGLPGADEAFLRAIAVDPDGRAARRGAYFHGVVVHRRGDRARAASVLRRLVETLPEGVPEAADPASPARVRLAELATIEEVAPAIEALRAGGALDGDTLARVVDAATLDELWPVRVADDDWVALPGVAIVDYARRVRFYSREVGRASFYYAVSDREAVELVVDGVGHLRVEIRPDCPIWNGEARQSRAILVRVRERGRVVAEIALDPVVASDGIEAPEMRSLVPGRKRSLTLPVGAGRRRLRVEVVGGSAHIRPYILHRRSDLLDADRFGATRLYAWLLGKLEAIDAGRVAFAPAEGDQDEEPDAEGLDAEPTDASEPVRAFYRAFLRLKLGRGDEADEATLRDALDGPAARSRFPAAMQARAWLLLDEHPRAIGALGVAVGRGEPGRAALHRAELFVLLARGADPTAALALVAEEPSLIPQVRADISVVKRILALAREGHVGTTRPYTRAFVRLAEQASAAPESLELAAALREAERGSRWQRVNPSAAPGGFELVLARQRGLGRTKRVREALFGEPGFVSRGQIVTTNRSLAVSLHVAEPETVELHAMPRALLERYHAALSGAEARTPMRLVFVLDGAEVDAVDAVSGRAVVFRTPPLPSGRHRLEVRLEGEAPEVIASVIGFKNHRTGPEAKPAFVDASGAGWFAIEDEQSTDFAVARPDAPIAFDLLGPTVLRARSRLFLPADADRSQTFHLVAEITDPEGVVERREILLTALPSESDRFRHLRGVRPSLEVETQHRLAASGVYRVVLAPAEGQLAVRVYAKNDPATIAGADAGGGAGDASPPGQTDGAAPGPATHAPVAAVGAMLGGVAGASAGRPAPEGTGPLHVAFAPPGPLGASTPIVPVAGPFPEERDDHGTWGAFIRGGVLGEGDDADERSDQNFISLGGEYRRQFDGTDVWTRLRVETFFLEDGAPGVRVDGKLGWRTPFHKVRLTAALRGNFQLVEGLVASALEGRIRLERRFQLASNVVWKPILGFDAVEQSIENLRGLDDDDVWFEVFNQFDKDHRWRIVHEQDLRWRPFLDLELFTRVGTFTNESFLPNDLDRVWWRLGVRGYIRDAFWELSYQHTYRFDDDDRRDDESESRITAKVRLWLWKGSEHLFRLEMRASYFLEDGELDAVFGLRWWFHDGRVLDDFDPAETPFWGHFAGQHGATDD